MTEFIIYLERMYIMSIKKQFEKYYTLELLLNSILAVYFLPRIDVLL
jgi:hypothetical protein